LFTLEEMLDAALDVGLDAMTLAAVASRLQVSVPALYRFVADRDELVARAADRVIARFRLPEQTELAQFLVETGMALRWLLQAHPGLGRLLLTRATQEVADQSERLFARLVELGLDPSEAVLAGSDTVSFTLAYAETEIGDHSVDSVAVGPVTREGERALADLAPDGVFRWSLRVHVEGMLAALARGDRPGSTSL